MEMLVTKFSKGKYRNESDLFAEPISKDNVKLMGEMIALQLFRTRKKHYCRIADKLYIGLIKDLHHMGETDYLVSDGYDYAQTAMCFLWQYKGKKADDICYTDDNGREISIKLACYRETGKHLDNYRRKMERIALSSSDDYKALPADPVNRFETEEPDYSKAEALMDAMHLTEAEKETLYCYMNGSKAEALMNAMHLTEAEKETLYCYMNGMNQSEAAFALGITIFGVKYRKLRIRYKYRTYIGEF